MGLENGGDGERGWPCYAFSLEELLSDPAYVAGRLGLDRADRRRFVAGWNQAVVRFLERAGLQAGHETV